MLQIKRHILLGIYKLDFIKRAKKVQNSRCGMKYNFTASFVAVPEPYEGRSFTGPAVVGWVAVFAVERPLGRGLFEPGGGGSPRPEPVGGIGTPLVGP